VNFQAGDRVELKTKNFNNTYWGNGVVYYGGFRGTIVSPSSYFYIAVRMDSNGQILQWSKSVLERVSPLVELAETAE